MNENKKKYHVRKNELGEKEYYIYAEGKWVLVDHGIYAYLNSTDRRQRSIDIVQTKNGYISIDALREAIANDEKRGYIPDELKLCSAEEEYFSSMELLEKQKQLRMIYSTLKKYKIESQFIIYGFYIKGLKVEEIAKKLGKSPKTIYKRKANIIKRLIRDCVGGEQ